MGMVRGSRVGVGGARRGRGWDRRFLVDLLVLKTISRLFFVCQTGLHLRSAICAGGNACSRRRWWQHFQFTFTASFALLS